MLKSLNPNQASFVAILAKAARLQRDELLGHVTEEGLVDSKGARGEHNPTAELGFDPLVSDAPQIATLRDAIAALSPESRSELYTLMRIGQGQIAAAKWHHGLVEAAVLGDQTVAALLIEDADLHDHLVKGLYEAKLAS